MKLPNSERLFIPEEKLEGYALNASHKVGSHKARLFRAMFDLTSENASVLRKALIEAATQSEDARYTLTDNYGAKYVLEFELATEKGKGIIFSSWMIRHGEDFPRLTSCYPLKKKGRK
ncbi:MAG: hypothetical protein IAF08_07800 [Rhizobacter sp.]|nr:hypothetical protein [Chlorobiales bacterium]